MTQALRTYYTTTVGGSSEVMSNVNAFPLPSFTAMVAEPEAPKKAPVPLTIVTWYMNGLVGPVNFRVTDPGLAVNVSVPRAVEPGEGLASAISPAAVTAPRSPAVPVPLMIYFGPAPAASGLHLGAGLCAATTRNGLVAG